MKKINVKETILSEIKNVELVSVKNFHFGCRSYGDVTIEFDMRGRHIVFTDWDHDFGGLFLGGWTEDEDWAEWKAEELGISVDELYDKYEGRDFEDEYNEYCAKVIEDEWYDIYEDDELMEIVAEYVENNIDDIYRLEYNSYSLNLEAGMSKLFVFDEFVGYVITEDFTYKYDTELFDKFYKNVGKIDNEDEDKLINGNCCYCVDEYTNEKYVIIGDFIRSYRIRDIKVDDNNDLYIADYTDKIAA